MEEHEHSDECYNEDGELVCCSVEHVHTDECYEIVEEHTETVIVCGMEEHEHVSACFDAPPAQIPEYYCGMIDHVHSEEQGCYFEDGSLKCTIPEHEHTDECKIDPKTTVENIDREELLWIRNSRTITSAPADDGAVASVTGIIPDGAEVRIEAVSLSEEDLAAYFGEEKASLMNSFVAYDIKILVEGEEWQPGSSVHISVEHPDIDVPANALSVAHIESDNTAVEALSSQVDKDGNISFRTDGFSVYVFYLFSVDYYYEDAEYHQTGMTTMYLSQLFVELGVERPIEDVASVEFSNSDLIEVESADGDWTLTSLQAFDSAETLTVTFTDGSEIAVDVFDDISVKYTVNDNYNLVSTVTDIEDMLSKYNIRRQLSRYGVTSATAIKSISITPSGNPLTATVSSGKGTITCTKSYNGARTIQVVFDVQEDGNDIACEFTNVTTYIYDDNKLWDYSGGKNGANSPKVIVGTFDKSIVTAESGTKNWAKNTTQKDKDNAPIGFSSNLVTSKGGSNLYPIKIDGNNYYLYVATSDTGDLGRQTRQQTPFPCVYNEIPIVAWIEDEQGNKVILPDVCVGNENGNTLWWWKFGGNSRQIIFANKDVQWSNNAYGTAVNSSSGSFQGIMSDENGYYMFSIARYDTRGSTAANYDEISVFRFESYTQVKKTVQDVNGNAVTGVSGLFNFGAEYIPQISNTNVTTTEEFTLTNGQTLNINGAMNKPVKVWEVVDPLYTTTVKINNSSVSTTTETITTESGESVTIIRPTNAPNVTTSSTVIEFINRKKAFVTVTKKFTGLKLYQIDELLDQFTITAAGNGQTYRLSLKQNPGVGHVAPSSISTDEMTYTWEIPDANQYVISESGTSVEGLGCITSVTDVNNGSYTKNGADYTVNFTSGSTGKSVTIENSYMPLLIVTKTITGTDSVTSLKFPVRIKATKEDGTPADLRQFEGKTESAVVSDITFKKSSDSLQIFDIVEFYIGHDGSFAIPLTPGFKFEVMELKHDGYYESIEVTDSIIPESVITPTADGRYTMPDHSVTAAITNEAGVPLPSTGGIGIYPFYAAGALLVCIFVYILMRKCERKKSISEAEKL